MEQQNVIEHLKEELELMHQQGGDYVKVNALQHYLSNLQHSRGKSSPQIKHLKDINISITESDYAQRKEIFRSVLASGQAALRSAMLINALIAIALIAFIGNILDSNSIADIKSSLIFNALILFLAGLFSASLASATTYISQSFYSNHFAKPGVAFQYVTALLIIASYGFFIAGSCRIYNLF